MALPVKRSYGFAVSGLTIGNLATDTAILGNRDKKLGYVHVTAWDEPNLSNIYYPMCIAIKNAGLQLVLEIECWDPATFREDLILPPGWEGAADPTFADGEWVSAFSDHVVTLANAVQADYVNIGVEANAYYDHDPEDWPNFLVAFTTIRSAIRELLPNCKVFTSYIYEKRQYR